MKTKACSRLHKKEWIIEVVNTRKGFLKRTFCPICLIYWEEKFKKSKK